MTRLHPLATGLACLCVLLFAAPARAQFDIAGMWAPLLHEDWFHRIPGATLGDYTGIPINAAARQKAEAWDAQVLNQQERQMQPHPAQYSFRGPGPQLRIDRILEPVTDRVIGYATYGTFGRADRTIWLDDRPHPPAEGLHMWNGFSTGRWDNNVLVVTTTHMKYGVYQRNGVPASPYAVMTEYFFRNGDYMTMVTHVVDPIYLEEPFVRSQTWVWNPSQAVGPAGPFESVEENEQPLGWVPHWPLGTRHPELANQVGIEIEGTQGGAETLYPEYRKKLQEMRRRFDAQPAASRPRE
ncbi:MAG: hypothetical protein AB7G23_09020 [Vicinamibacterales bacterium]